MCNCTSCNTPLINCNSACANCNAQPITQNPCLSTPCIDACADTLKSNCIFMSKPVTLCGTTIPSGATLQVIIEQIGSIMCNGITVNAEDKLVKVSATDAVGGYLGEKLVDSTTVDFQVVSTLGVETMKAEVVVPSTVDWKCLNAPADNSLEKGVQKLIDQSITNSNSFSPEFTVTGTNCAKTVSLTQGKWIPFLPISVFNGWTLTSSGINPLDTTEEPYMYYYLDSFGNITIIGTFINSGITSGRILKDVGGIVGGTIVNSNYKTVNKLTDIVEPNVDIYSSAFTRSYNNGTHSGGIQLTWSTYKTYLEFLTLPGYLAPKTYPTSNTSHKRAFSGFLNGLNSNPRYYNRYYEESPDIPAKPSYPVDSRAYLIVPIFINSTGHNTGNTIVSMNPNWDEHTEVPMTIYMHVTYQINGNI